MLLKLMSNHLERYPFLLGPRITLADFAFYGTFYAHLSRDPVPGFIMKTEAPLVFEWVERVGGLARWYGVGVERWQSAQGKWTTTYGETANPAPASAAGNPRPAPPQGIEGGGVPASANGVAQLLFGDYAAVLLDTLTRTLQYLEDKSPPPSSSSSPSASSSLPRNPTLASVSLPRTLGKHGFRIGSSRGKSTSSNSSSSSSSNSSAAAHGERAVYTHGVWIFDRLLRRGYASSEQRASADEWLRTLSRSGQEEGNVEAREGEEASIAQLWTACVQKWEAGGWRIERVENKLVARKGPDGDGGVKEKEKEKGAKANL